MSFPTRLIACLIRRQLNALMPGLVAPPSLAQIQSALTAPGQAFEIEEREINGHTVKTWKNANPDARAFVTASREYGDRDYVILNDQRLSYEQHYQQVARVANALVGQFDIQKGDRVAIAMRNYPEWSVAFWATLCAGAVVVPMNAWWTPRELAYGLSDSGAKLAFVDDKRLARIQEIEEELPLQHLVAARTDPLPEGVHDMTRLLDEGDGEKLPDVQIDGEDDATLFYTSGTTGFPKGTRGTHRNFCSAGLNGRYTAIQNMLRGGIALRDLVSMAKNPQAMLLPVPLFHVTGCQGVMLGMFGSGGKVVMMNYWEPGAALDIIERESITAVVGVPAMTSQLVDYPGVTERKLDSVRNLGSGGAAVPPELRQRISETFPGTTVSNGYGITETSAAICAISGKDYAQRPTSCGAPVPVCEVRVVDPDGRDQPVGSPGELWVRAPTVVKGYWNKPEATEEAFADGWYRTGDVGRYDSDGFLYIEDRIKDMVIRGGENIYSAEVEAALSEHPDVRMACVFGIPDEVMGEEVGAVVQVDPGHALSEGELQEFVARGLAGFKVPSRIWLQDTPFPLGATGKVQKKDLREHYLAQLQA